jgi:hypothetical protein
METNLTLFATPFYILLVGARLTSLSNDIYDKNQFTPMPSVAIEYKNMDDKTYGTNDCPSLQKIKDTQDFDEILSFSQKMISETKDIDADIQSYVNDHFWEMI